MDLAADRRAIAVYLLVTWTASCLFCFLIIKSAGTRAADGAYTSGLMLRVRKTGKVGNASFSTESCARCVRVVCFQ